MFYLFACFGGFQFGKSKKRANVINATDYLSVVILMIKRFGGVCVK